MKDTFFEQESVLFVCAEEGDTRNMFSFIWRVWYTKDILLITP